MSKFLLAFASLALLLVCSSALYKHQVGEFDWNIRAIGDIEKVQFQGNRASFVTKDGFIGTFAASTGEIEWSRDLASAGTFADLVNRGFVVIDANTQTISMLELINGLNQHSLRLPEISANEQIIDVFFNRPAGQGPSVTGVLTDKNIYLFHDDKFHAKQAVSTPLRYLRSSKDNSVYGVSETEKEVCFHSINVGDSTGKSSKKCFSRSDVTLNRNEAIIREKSQIRVIAFDRNGQELSHNVSSSASYLGQCGILVVQGKSEAKIFSVGAQGKSFEQVTTVDLATESTSISCAIDADNTRYLIISEQPAPSTLKIKSINLSSPKTPARILFDNIVDFNVGKIVEVFADRIGGDYRLVIKTENLQILGVAGDRLTWRREDSLSEIQEVQFFEYQSLEAQELNPYFEHLDEHKDNLADLPANIIRRLTAQSAKFTRFVNEFISTVTSPHFNIKDLIGRDANFEKQSGLQKIIIAATRRNTVFGIDSKTGKIFWEKVIDNSWRIVQIYKTKGSHAVKDVLVYLVDNNNKSAKFLHLNPLDGAPIVEKQLTKVPRELIRIQLPKAVAFLIVNGDNDIQLYPETVERREVSEYLKDLSIYKVGEREVIGYQLLENKLVPTWNLNLQKDEEVFRTSQWSYDIDETSFKTIIPEDKKVIYKFSDSNNFALLTKSTFDKAHLNLYIINGVTGRILSSRTQNNVDFEQPINLLYDENGVFVTYFNTDILNFEIWVTELYKQHLESSFQHLLYRYFFEKIHVDEEEKYNQLNAGFEVFTQKYYFGPGVKALGAVETIQGVTKKNLIIVTLNDQIYSLDRGLLSTRRQPSIDNKPLESDALSFASADLPPYVPTLPIIPKNYLTYYRKFTGLNRVEATPSRLESTSLVFIAGHDVVFVRTAPEKEFDMLSSDFKYEILFGSMALIAVGLVVVKGLMKKHKISRLFLN